MAFVFTDDNFKKEIETGISLVDFWAPWCGPCQMLGPIIEELAVEYKGKVKVGKMNVDENIETPQEFGIMGIPAIKIFQDSKLVDEIVGYVPAETIKQVLNKYLNA